MVICIVALFVFGALSIFSAKYRPLAAEAFDCVFRKLTLRPCQSGLDERLKAQITGSLMTRNEGLAKLVFKNFEAISLAFTLMFLLSFAYTVYGGYNYVKYGDCYGPETTAASGLCIYKALEGETTSQLGSTGVKDIVFPTVDDDPSIGPKEAKVTVIEFGCMMCPYTKKAEPVVKELLKRYEGRILFVYRDFPLSKLHAAADYHSEAANCAGEQGKYWEYRDLAFEMQTECKNATDHIAMLKGFASDLGLNRSEFDACFDSRKYTEEVQSDFNDGVSAGLTGTPTFFINNRTIVGPRPIDAYAAIIDEELAKAAR